MAEHHHDHSHEDHGHSHRDRGHGGAGHVHAPAQFGRAFAIGIILNAGFVLVEAFYGLIGNSVALLADAGHNLGDVLGLIVAWMASSLARRAPSERYTFGWRSSSIMAALFNAVFLLVTAGALSWEAIQRLGSPVPVASVTMMVVAAIGIGINGVTAWLFHAGSKDDLNVRGAFLHMAADALVSAGVVVAGLLITFTSWFWLDPVMSLIVNLVIILGTWGLLREALAMTLLAVPAGVDAAKVKAFLAAQKGVASVHDLHIWSMSTTEIALTCHLVMPGGHPGDSFIHHTSEELAERFNIRHATLQIEINPDLACALAPAEVV